MDAKTRRITTTAVAAALVYVVTVFISIKVPAINGAYFNLGDVVIYCAAYIFGGPYAAIAAAIGSGLADFTVGSAIYMPATIVIKAGMALIVGALSKSNASFKNYVCGCVIAALVMAFGYFCYETILAGIGASILTLVPNLIQAGCGAGIALVLYRPMFALRNKLNLRVAV
ncbi:MAG: ECF transporter S component [Christensenella sp.]